MTIFLRWIVIHIILFALLFFGAKWWLGKNPQRVLVAVDASFDMTTKWLDVRDRLDEVAENPGPYTVFALITDKGQVHGWQEELDLGSALAFGPRGLEVLKDDTRFPLLKEATRFILITNADDPGIKGWEIVRP